MKSLIFKIDIGAPVDKVWDVMLQPDTYRQWVGSSWPDSFYKGKWEEGEKIRFISDDESGILGLIVKLIPYEFVLVKHIALLDKGGIEDTESEMAKEWIGTSESYTFSQKEGRTELTIQLNIPEKFVEMFDKGWPQALQQLKVMCEK